MRRVLLMEYSPHPFSLLYVHSVYNVLHLSDNHFHIPYYFLFNILIYMLFDILAPKSCKNVQIVNPIVLVSVLPTPPCASPQFPRFI